MQVWEAGLTLGFIPIIILCSYAAEKGWLDLLFCQGNKVRRSTSLMTDILLILLSLSTYIEYFYMLTI